ncbi:MAG: ATP-binding response regulator [Planctomycetota bacterium]|jgi:PAS domain S-box-containing protein
MTDIGDKGPLLLVVDDRQENLSVLRKLIEKGLPGTTVLTASDATEGLAAASTLVPDGAIIDVRMPHIDGIEMCQRLKNDPATADVSVVLMTGHGADAQLKARGLDAGADDFLHKPIDTQELLARIKVMLRIRRAEKELRGAKDFLQRVIDSVPEAIVVTDLQCRILLANQTVFDLWEVSEAAAKEKTCYELFHSRQTPCHEDGLTCPLQQVLATGQPAHVEHDHTGPSGYRRFTEVTAAPVLDDSGNVVQFIEVMRDITERKDNEAALARYRDRLRTLASELSAAEERERRRLAADLHDHISQGLVASATRLQLLHDSAPESLTDDVQAVSEMVNQILKDTRSLTFELCPPMLYDLGLAAALSWLTEELQERHGIECEFVSTCNDISLDDDLRALLFRATRELLTNVVKHSHATRADVSLLVEDDAIIIEVTDNGTGFDPASAEPGDGSKNCFGLFSVRERLQSVGGQMTIEPAPGGGTRIAVTVPAEPIRHHRTDIP